LHIFDVRIRQFAQCEVNISYPVSTAQLVILLKGVQNDCASRIFSVSTNWDKINSY